MAVTSEVIVGDQASTYPSLWEHIPTGCIILFVDANEGWLVCDPKKQSSRPVGNRWNNCSPTNYKVFSGAVTLRS